MATDALDPSGTLAELFGILGSERSRTAILDDVVGLAQRRVPGAEQASLTVIRNRKAGTVCSTDGFAMRLDELQYERGFGPCLEAGRMDEVLLMNDSEWETRWPGYVEVARMEGLRSSLSLPLPVESYLVGALNLYATRPAAFSPEAVTLGKVLAAYVTAVLRAAEAMISSRERAENLERAMETRAVIEQAKGIIMAQRKCSAGDAFALLREQSMRNNLKLAELAASLVTSASGHRV